MNKIRVAQIVRSPAGGIRKHIVDLVNGLSADKYDFLILTNIKYADSEFSDFLKNIPSNISIRHISILSKPGFRDFKNLLQTFLCLVKWRPDIVHGHGAKGGLLARLIGTFLGKKVVYTPHGGSLHSMHGVLSPIFILVEKVLYFFSDLIIFESKYSMSQYKQKIISSSRKYILNYNGIDIDTQVTSRSKLCEPLKIASFGALRQLKGHDIAIDALSILRSKGISFKYSIFGEGEEKEALEKQILASGLKGSCLLEGDIKSVKEHMLSCDLILQPSRNESFGYTILEALSVGTPVIASRVGGMVEIIEDGISGLLVNGDSPEELADAICKLIDRPELYYTLSKSGYERVGECFSKKIMLSKLNELYREVLN